MNNRYINLFRFFFTFIDLLALNGIHAIMSLALKNIPNHAETSYLYFLIAANMLWLVSAYGTGLYLDNAVPSGERFSKRTLQTFLLFNFFMLAFMFFYHYPYSRLFMISSFGAFMVFLILTRGFLIGFSFYMQKMRYINKKVVILGYNEIAKTLVSRFATQRKNYQVAGYFEDESNVHELSVLPIIGGIASCIQYAKENNVQEIYSTISPEKNSELYEMAVLAERSFIRFKFVPDFKLYVNRNTYMEYLAEIPILSLRPEPMEDMGSAFRKRVFDIFFSLFVIAFVLSWLIPLMAILIKLNSAGPVFFAQMRSGKNNKEFRCLKFRTLKVNDDANSIQVTKDDARLTGLGRFLRKSNIDELPQFLNVLIGDMSIVGPRPHMLKHTASFSKIMDEYMIRHLVKPGVTGWAQINGYRGEIKKEEQLRKRIEYDIWYMENWSFWLDFKIIFLTVYKTLIGDKNAY